MTTLKQKVLISAAVISTSLMMSVSSAWAITSCWQASDPPGCWLQCTFGGPCPLESVSQVSTAIEFKLPKADSEASQHFGEVLKKREGPSLKEINRSREMYGKVSGQTCKPEQLLAVMTKAVDQSKDHLGAAQIVAKSCLK